MTAIVRPTSLQHRLRMGGAHLVLSLLVAALSAALVLGVWYPSPYREVSGGLHLFSILVVVDVMLGPLATVVVSRQDKSRREWRMDVALIIAVQLVALAYGIWTMYQARPVYLAYEIDRMRIVHAVDVPTELLSRAPEGLQSLPLGGPRLVAVRPFASEAEKAEMTMAALQGVELGFRPDLWVPFEAAKPLVRSAAHPVQELLDRYPDRRNDILEPITSRKLSSKSVKFLPMHGRTQFWTVLIDEASAEPIAYLELDPY